MIFAKIDYINLLPFYIFIKKNLKSSRVKAIINYKKSYPALINKQFKRRQIDAAFISSVASRGEKSLDLGIVAKGKVLSVLLIPGEYEKDFESSTSNVLAKVLNLEGKIIIGDKALIHYYKSENKDFIDLAQAWNEKHNMPFVFARLCYNSNGKFLKNLSKKFLHKKVKIPQYILKKYSQRSGISTSNILKYLEKIEYKISEKEKKSLKLFLKLSKNISYKESN
ncbi:MAG: hypothetical protein HRT43_09715 [Campylobacteraceae bacterium]|nr:hypothetical protein [Campylobacteraceae bacterium]